MNKGRAKCDRLKKIRKAVADKLHVDLHQSECTFEGNCRGTCPKCRQEEEILNRELLKRAAGLGVGTLAGLSLAGCAPLGNETEGAPVYEEPAYEEMQTQGEVPWPEEYWTEGAPVEEIQTEGEAPWPEEDEAFEEDDTWTDDGEAAEGEECYDDIEGLVPAENNDMNESEVPLESSENDNM